MLKLKLYNLYIKKRSLMLMDYHKRLKELRVQNGFTQEQVAFILHTRQEQYSKYESGKRELPIKHLIALCLLYRVSADYVLGIEKFVN